MNCLGLFARYPEPGRTKTRLAANIGNTAAARLYECFVRDLTVRCATLCDDFVIAATPETAASRRWFEALPADHPATTGELAFQPDGNLGDRITWFFDRQFDRGRAATVLIGTDSPDLPDGHITQAFDVLRAGRTDMVVSPAADGGFVLVGMTGRPRSVFREIRWSSPWTLLDTLASAEQHGRHCRVLEPWYDIDTVDNLGTLAALQRHPGNTSAAECPVTFALLRELLPEISGALER